MNDQLYWANGREGRELDLAGLVCNRLAADRYCINPLRGEEGGQTWEMRQKIAERVTAEL